MRLRGEKGEGEWVGNWVRASLKEKEEKGERGRPGGETRRGACTIFFRPLWRGRVVFV